jgi:hypothetical protein
MTISSTIRRPLLGAAVLAATAAATAVPSPAATNSKPSFSTNGASHIVGTSAQLQGTDTPNGQATSYYFEYGPTVAYGNSSKPAAVAIPTTLTSVVRVGQTVTGIAVGWHYRIVGLWTNPATGVQEKIPGKDKQFKGRKSGKARLEVGKGKEDQITTVFGGTAEVAGTLTGTGNASQSLSLQAMPYPFTAVFKTLPGTVLTGRTGSFVFKVPRVTQNTEVRVQTLAARPLFSPTIVIHVTPKITLHVRSAGNTGLYRLYGTVSPARNGAPVQIQQLLPQKPSSKREGPRPHPVASTVLKRKTSSMSRFSVIVKLSGTFHYRAFVRLPKGAVESGHGSDALIKAPASGKTHHR